MKKSSRYLEIEDCRSCPFHQFVGGGKVEVVWCRAFHFKVEKTATFPEACGLKKFGEEKKGA